MYKIGFLDSGIGGLTVLESCFHKWQEVSKSGLLEFAQTEKQAEIDEIIYLADTVNLPYGEKSLPQLRQILLDNLGWFAEKEISCLVLACNTSSVLFDSEMRRNLSQSSIGKFAIITLLDSLALKIQADYKHLKNICIISTQATHQTGAYIQSLKGILSNDANIISIPCPKLVPLIESSIDQGLSAKELYDKAKPIVAEYCALIPSNCEALIFGCSHYPLLQETFAESLPKVIFLNPANALSERVSTLRLKLGLQCDSSSQSSLSFPPVAEQNKRTKWLAFSTANSNAFERKLNSLNGVFDCAQYFGNKVRTTQHFANPIKT